MKKNTPAGSTESWISPSRAMDMVYDVRSSGCDDIGYALLRQRAKGATNTFAALLTAKMQPVRPAADCWRTRCGFATTARDARLILAPGVADPVSIARFAADYDAATRPHQKLLAAVLTMKFDRDTPVHDGVDMVMAYTTLMIARGRRLSSIVVVHTPAEELCDAPTHAHVVVCAREHRPGTGFGAVHPSFTDEDHAFWNEEWRAFQSAWARQLEK